MYDNERLNLTQISEILKSKASHPTVLVDRLVQLEYLERVVANADKRSREVSITVKGKAVVPKIEAVVRASLSASLNHIKRSDLEVYYKVLQQLAGQEDR